MHSYLLQISTFADNLFKTFFSLIKLLIFSKLHVEKAVKQSSEAVILANGPSLKFSLENNRVFFENKDIFCVNLFASTPYYTELKPTNYILLDDAFTDVNHQQASLAISSLIANTSWPVNLHIPYKFKNSPHLVHNIKKNSFIKPIYFNYVILETFDLLRFFLFRHGLGMPQCQNVLIASIFTCINMMYSKIYLFGADHTWHENIKLDDENEIIALDTHFYGVKTYKTTDSFSQNESYLARQFLSLHKVFRGYEIIARYANYRHVTILNASVRSYIDVFKKIKV